MRILYFDCLAGISGDMALGALIDAGADLTEIRERLGGLAVEPFSMELEDVETHGMVAKRVTVKTEPTGVIRTYGGIRTMLERSDLPAAAEALAQRIFRRLAEAEAAVHHRDVDQVAFHEVGAVDSIVDICGTALAWQMLGIERAFASPVPTGLGMVRTEHGMMPIPAPAVVELLRGVPIYSRGIPMELVTPTGAAILAATVEGFGEMPAISIDSVGYGSGSPRTDFPNVLRVLIGDEATGEMQRTDRQVSGELVLETNVDDLNPELYAYVLEQLLDAGAQDAWLTPIVMKKGRAAVKISVLCSAQRADAIRLVLYREAGTLGVRSAAVEKQALERTTTEVNTRGGVVRVKIGLLDGRPVTVSPEYEDCARAAREAGVPAREIFEEASRLAREEIR